MTAKWTGTSGSTNIDHGHVPPITLSDGTVVFIDADSSSSPYTCYLRYCSPTGSADPTTPNAIATITAGAPVVGLTRDSSNNIFVVYSATSTLYTTGQAFKFTGTLGSSYTWATETALAASSAAPAYTPSGGQIITWADDGGGTNGAGHILLAGAGGSGSNETLVVYVLDAGALLAGTGTLYVGATAAASGSGGSGDPYYWLANNGFGATSGLLGMVINNLSGAYAYSWSVTSAGVVTMGSEVTGGGGYAAAGTRGTLVSLGSGTWVYVYPSGTTAGGYMATVFTPTGAGSPVDAGSPANLPLNGHGYNWAAFADPTTAGKAWVIAPGTVAGTSLPVYRLSLTVSGTSVSWSSAVTADDTLTVYASTVGSFNAVVQPVLTRVDWMATEETSSGTWALVGDYSVFAQDPSVALNSPISGTYLDAVSPITLAWTYTNTDGSTQGAWALRVKSSTAPFSGSYLYWDASTSTWASTIVWNTGTPSSTTLPASTLSDGTLYYWNINVQSSNGSAYTSGFAPADFLVNTQAAPTVTVTGPTGTQATSQPTVTYATTVAAGTSLQSYRIMVYPSTISSPVPGVTAGSVWDSGVVAGAPSGSGTVVGSPLANEASFYAYMQVTETNNESSGWATSPIFTETYSLPPTPTFSAANGTDPNGVPCIVLSVNEGSTGETSPVLTITYSDANGSGTVRYAAGVPIALSTALTFYDYEATPGIARMFSASVTAIAGTVLVTSASATASATLSIGTDWWFIEPLTPASSISLAVTDNPTSQHESIAVHYPISKSGVIIPPTIIAGGINGQDGGLTVETQSLAAWQALKASLTSGTVKWLISPFSEGFYVRVSAANPVATSSTAGASHQTTLKGPATSPQRASQITYVEMAAPGQAGLG